ncbi:MAG: hypothetical protein WD512_07295 [Candidatus Paceibacterota bacterium]
MRKISITLFVTLLLFAIPNIALAQCETQNRIEENIHTLTVEYRKQIYETDNAIKKIRLYKDWYQEIKKVICLGKKLEFTGLVWSVDFDNESSFYVLRIGNQNESVPIPTFYNYQFSNSDGLIDKLAELNRRDKVKFIFTFKDTFFPDSTDSERFMEFRGFPAEKNPDTGNYVYMLFIDLIDIELIKE